MIISRFYNLDKFYCMSLFAAADESIEQKRTKPHSAQINIWSNVLSTIVVIRWNAGKWHEWRIERRLVVKWFTRFWFDNIWKHFQLMSTDFIYCNQIVCQITNGVVRNDGKAKGEIGKYFQWTILKMSICIKFLFINFDIFNSATVDFTLFYLTKVLILVISPIFDYVSVQHFLH